jgi:hypothetical protein
MIFDVLRNFVNSNIKYILTTSHPTSSVKDLERMDGSYRLLNLFLGPYNFPEPLYRLDDTYGGHPTREMCVWSREQISEVINK